MKNTHKEQTKMKFITSIFYLLSLLTIVSCSKDDGKIDLTFLQLNDVYEIAPIQDGEYGGLARVETVHKQLLEENPNTMLFLAGDFLNPSLLGSIKVDGERVRGKQMVEVMNAMNFDLVAFGNHEFDISQKDLQKRLNESNFPWISANIKLKTDEGLIPFYKEINGQQYPVGETFIKEFSDEDGTKIKVGFISVCIPSNPKDFVEYGDMYKKIRSSYEAIQEDVDVVFGLTHVALENDKKIAKLLPNIPLIMGGHEHTHSNNFVGDVQISKADANAKTVYIHKIVHDKNIQKTTVTSELKEINSSIKDDEKVEAVVKKWQTILVSQIKNVIQRPNEVIFDAKIPLDGRDTPIRSKQTNLGQVITKAMSFAFKDEVDCALVNGGSIRIDDQLSGAITALDIFRVLPYGGGVLKVGIKGRLLEQVLNYGAKVRGKGAYLQRYNVQQLGDQWMIKNKPLVLNNTYTVAFSDYLLKGLDIPFLTQNHKGITFVIQPQNDDLAFDIRKVVINYLKTL
jgi:2',3'-cyclic-nucleotide 2'-phosphodiesterase (5'-nucleotidase family)